MIDDQQQTEGVTLSERLVFGRDAGSAARAVFACWGADAKDLVFRGE